MYCGWVYFVPIFSADDWTCQPTTGETPPPLVSHTFTMIDDHRAAVFGGSSDGSVANRLNETYVLDMEKWVRLCIGLRVRVL